MAGEIRILLVDDHGIFRAGLRALLKDQPDALVVGEAANGRDAVELAQGLNPDVVVMDLQMPDLNGIDATRKVLERVPSVRVIGLSANFDQRRGVELLRAGAAGFVAKDSAFDELVEAIHIVMKNGLYFTREVLAAATQPGNSMLAGNDFAGLTAREREVLQLLAEGHSTKEVAAGLKVSLKTAESHRRNLMEKLRVDSIAELTKYAIREGLTGI